MKIWGRDIALGPGRDVWPLGGGREPRMEVCVSQEQDLRIKEGWSVIFSLLMLNSLQESILPEKKNVVYFHCFLLL